MDVERVVFNGVDGASGKYLIPELEPRTLGALVRGETGDQEQLAALRWYYSQATEPRHPLAARRDPTDLAQTGWGVIFPTDVDPDVRGRLGRLLAHRRAAASRENPCYYRELEYQPGETKNGFLERFGVAYSPVHPQQLPYYLLIVGSPESIPFQFQYDLDVQYAVGRLDLDTPEDYEAYARHVVAAEEAKGSRSAVFFAASNRDDAATRLSAEHLVCPLASELSTGEREWSVESIVGESATKARLGRVLAAPEPPALLFTASQGMGFPSGDDRQASSQGALLCQDWPGPTSWSGRIPESFYFAADDVPPDASLQGMIAFLFACHSAGTPLQDDFGHGWAGHATQIAPRAFSAALPKRLLASGALAVVGHVERAWACSFYWSRAGQQLEVFRSMLQQLMDGSPVGAAMECFNLRYAELASEFGSEMEALSGARLPDYPRLAELWTARNDARGYVIAGDPAVGLPAR